ncbi:MAG TPA: hemerythrin domain-containing protein [Steroidobacteraceae bacterium]|nr:hemerythrin domain-containing protein [Steroidobacteraceae bacterium]
MARARPASLDDDSDDIAPDALSVLRRDHRLAEELFAEFARSAPQQLDPLARRICKMLRVHTQIEEELFYPAVSRALTEQDRRLVDHAQVEHQQAKEAIARIESMTSENPSFRNEVDLLDRRVAQHVASEEHELFPKVSAAGLDLIALGIALTERRDTLMDVLGLHGDDEEGAANQRETRSDDGVEPRPTSVR